MSTGHARCILACLHIDLCESPHRRQQVAQSVALQAAPRASIARDIQHMLHMSQCVAGQVFKERRTRLEPSAIAAWRLPAMSEGFQNIGKNA